ncbi:hypothetical protein [Flavivirga eckloniae]|uniref:Kazal-like domain-containing protein n=1 Tax=Flavivirga eckloniae TaxID=1803846 RepID=A0A2K9PVT0_9FLAO|nr:hypothetical protein [Flavivirga eckloniae]AUP81172.1 hypothetical protein C1H87_21635 [Flavivirga eckloniae]
MKKVISILGIAVFAIVLFANSNNITNNQDLDLTNLSLINVANAESPYWPDTDPLKCRCHNDGICYGGNYISFRKKCAEFTSGQGVCGDHSPNCPS